MRNLPLYVLLLCTLWACGSKPASEASLPIYGVRQLSAQGDTIYHQIGPFSFVNQDSQQVTQKDFENKIYVADFFFTHCPSICPNMTAQLFRVYEAYQDNPEVALLSHSIDPVNDSVATLKAYAEKLGVETQKWSFVTGNREDIYSIAKEKYYISAMEDKEAPGGYLHNSKFILVDGKGRIRGYYTGTEREDVDRMMEDMELLLSED